MELGLYSHRMDKLCKKESLRMIQLFDKDLECFFFLIN